MGSIEKHNPICKLWAHYFHIIFVVKDFTFSEKNENRRELSTREISKTYDTFFNATKDFNCDKSAQIYFDDISKNL